MRTIFSLLITTFLIGSASAQLTGEVVESKRKILDSIDYSIEHTSSGDLYFKIAIDNYGRVTSISHLRHKSTIVSTPAMLKAKAAISKMKFEAGGRFPRFQYGIVKINVVDADKRGKHACIMPPGWPFVV